MTHSIPPHSAPAGVVSSGWLAADSTFGQVDQRKTGRALAASLALHGLGLLIILAVMSMVPEAVISPQSIAEKYDLIFVQAAGPGGGGGGGGNSMPTPPKTLEMKAALPAPPVVEPVDTPPPPPSLMAPIQTSAAILPTAGVMTGLAAAPSLGLGTGGGGGTGKGTGVGSGDGSGVGPGSGGGVGGGPMGPGSGATPPTLLRGVDPTYTPAAMQAKIQGTVELEVLVSPSGAVSDVKVIRSLDKTHGLDDLAVVTAKKWLFRPARFQGQAVAYLVIIQMAFTLR
jgi:TonB family protein